MITNCFVIFLFISVITILISTSIITFYKKSIYYQYIDKSKEITSFDYIQNFDGNWLFVFIDYAKLIKEYPTDTELISKVIMIKTLNRLYKLTFVILLCSLVVVIILKNFDLF